MTTRAIYLLVVVFGVWTVVAHACTLMGGSLLQLMVAFGGVMVVATRWLRRLWQFDPEPGVSSRERIAVGFLVLGAAALAWLAKRPDADDAIYLNLAVTAADFPRVGLGTIDGLFGLEPPSQLLRPYRLHSLELIAGAFRVLTGIESRFWMHAVLPPLAAAITVLAQVELARELAGRRWLTTTCLALLFLALVGDGWQSHGHHGIARMHQGKSLLVNAMLPLCLAQALRVHRHPSPREGIRMWLIAVGAVGCSANGLVLVPLLLLITHVAQVGWGFPRHSSAVWVGVSIVTCAGLSAWAYAGRVGSEAGTATTGLETVQFVVARALGNPALATVTGAFALVGVWHLKPRPVLLALTACVGLTVLNPLLAGLLDGVIQRTGILPRAVWILPLPILVGAGLLSMMKRIPIVRSRAGVAAALVMLGLFLSLPGARPLQAVLQRSPTRFDNVPPPFDIARAAVARSQAQGVVLAPPAVSAWIPTMHHHPPVVASRPIYADYLADQAGPAQAELRERLTAWADGREPHVDCRDLPRLEVTLVITRDSATAAGAQLERCGFVVVQQDREWLLWDRRSP